ncbi:cohesin domain-containing protein [bacterium]|nr:cohesin domain-containing protein [bacterium]
MNYKKEKRAVDKAAKQTYSLWKKSFIFINKTKIKTWKGLSAITFIAGISVAIILTISADIHIVSKAAGETASLALTPSAISVKVGNIFTVNVMLNTESNSVVVTRAIINYNTSNFSLTDWNISDSVFNNDACVSEGKTACEIVDDTVNGIIDITVAKPSPGVNTSSGLIATLTFEALQTTTDNITINFIPESYTDSDVILDNIGDNGEGTDILSSIANAIITVDLAETCGDGYCAGIANDEDCNACPLDCISGQGGTCSACWKGVCDNNCNPRKETLACADCAENYCCGDSVCNGLENIENCLVDCGCFNNSDCNDNEICTTDICNNNICENNWPACGLNDGCCALNCTPATDLDCVELDCSMCWKGVCDGVCHAIKENSTCPDCQ